MAGATRTASAMAVMILATAAFPPRGAAADPLPAATGSRAEVQIGLCSPAGEIVRALALHPHGAPITVWQFDDAALGLFERGLRLRLRVAKDGRSEFTLKVADQDCARLNPGLVPPREGKCEYDVYGARQAGAVSLSRSLDVERTADLIAGRATPAALLSSSQIRYLREVAGVWPLPPGIRGLGPMHVRTYRTADNLYDIDISQLPDGEAYAEISRKVPLQDAARTMADVEALLSKAGIATCADQTSHAVDKLRSLVR